MTNLIESNSGADKRIETLIDRIEEVIWDFADENNITLTTAIGALEIVKIALMKNRII